ncbi:hypothetical protein TorRG33x02_144330 [Trema orientale]|uniref:Uncharacterized protein n=1 Tax=Trema orientale TaxID=63057 RepID=A0A2P5EW35_TREOI|nr:hypothetical protein TorRG33x02_144330 [Trema orientale]
MAKKRKRHQNPKLFLAEDNEDSVSSKKRSKAREGQKQYQMEEKLLSSGMSSKILKEALVQQRQVEDERVHAHAQNPKTSLLTVTLDPPEDEANGDDTDLVYGFDET